MLQIWLGVGAREHEIDLSPKPPELLLLQRLVALILLQACLLYRSVYLLALVSKRSEARDVVSLHVV
jgi:hypothetical protein